MPDHQVREVYGDIQIEATDTCYLCAHRGALEGFRYEVDHIFNYLIFLRSLDSGKIACYPSIFLFTPIFFAIGPSCMPGGGTYMSPQLFPRLTIIGQYWLGVLKLSSSEVSRF